MSLTREEVLVDCLKKVSLQRFRSLKMDMQKLSRDSRISNERNFWSLLEFHSIKLDERTKREFRREILDNRGINIETALRYLKRAQRKTGRDSVEVLIKENQPRAISERNGTTGRTPTSTVETQIRNYKLDKLRSKAIGIGKLRAAFKSPTVSSALPAIKNAAQIDHSTESVKTLKHPGNIEKVNDLLKNEKVTTKDSVKAPETKDDNASLSLFKMLLQEESKHTEKELRTSKVDIPNNKPVRRDSGKTTETNDKNEPKMTGSGTTNNEKKQEELSMTMVAPKTTKTTIQSKKVDKEGDHSDLGIEISPKDLKSKGFTECEDVISENTSPIATAEIQSYDKHGKNNEKSDTTTPECEVSKNDITAVDKHKPSDYQNEIITINNNSDSNSENSMISKQKGSNYVKTLISEKICNESENKTEFGNKLNKTDINDGVIIKIEPIYPNKQKPQEIEGILEEGVQDECTKEDNVTKFNAIDNNDELKQVTEETVKEETNTFLLTKYEEVKTKEVSGEKQVLTADTNTSDKHNKRSENEIKRKEMKANQKVKSITSNPEKTNSEVGEVTIIKDEEISDNNKDEEKHEEHITSAEEQEIIQTQKFSDTHSISTLSSVDDEIFSLDDIIRDMSSSTCGTVEEIHVGGNTVLMQIPEWIKENEHKFNNPGPLRSKMEVDWVYGCNTTYPQCMTSLPCGSLVYYVGCIVIVYNHERKTQRHYLGHSATVSSVSAHPKLQHVASSQLSSPTNELAPHKSHDHGKIHVRIWNSVTMETIHVVGAGTLRDPIFKLQFLLMEDYLVTIENNNDNVMTIWDGGCRVTCTTLTKTSGDQNIANVPKPQIAWNHKKFVPTLPRSPYRPSTTKNLLLSNDKKLKEKKFPQIKVNTSGARGLTFNHNDDGGFSCVGKHHLTFWQIEVDFEEEGRVKLAEPVNGDFGKFFRAEYLSCCLATNKFLDDSIITGDSNGTLLIWSEKTRTATRGYSHAHECHLSAICVSNEGIIFTSGARDKMVKAFLCKHSKLELCGVLEIPSGIGSATSLTAIDNTLFVATEIQVIVSVQFDLFDKNTNGSMTSSMFGDWDEFEVARGFRKGVRSCCSITPLQEKIRNRKVQNRDIKIPGVDGSLEIMRSQFSKQTGVRKYLRDTTRLDRNNVINDIRRPNTSASSPRLRANERILQRCRNDNNIKPAPYFATDNIVRKSEVFCSDDIRTSALKDYFVTSSNDGWLILARFQLPQPCDVTCVDTCSKRNLVCVGTSTGHVFIAGINNRGFEILPQLQCKCSGGGTSYINTVRFSPSGRKVAISIGYDIIIASVRRLAVTELGRCIGHHSDVIIGLDWSSKKYSSTYFLRSCAIKPTPEIKTWHSDTMLEVRSLDLLNRVAWATTSSFLDYSIKGIWGNFINDKDVSASCVYSATKNVENSNKNDVSKYDETEKIVVIGELSGAISSQTYPCLRWIENENTRRAHFTPVNTIAVLSEERHLLTTGKYEDSLVQWNLN